jgi:hypothetical protein
MLFDLNLERRGEGSRYLGCNQCTLSVRIYAYVGREVTLSTIYGIVCFFATGCEAAEAPNCYVTTLEPCPHATPIILYFLYPSDLVDRHTHTHINDTDGNSREKRSNDRNSSARSFLNMSEAGRPSTNSLTRIDVGSLEADLNRFRVQLDQWADSLVARTRNEKDEHLRALGQLAGTFLFFVGNGCVIDSVTGRLTR